MNMQPTSEGTAQQHIAETTLDDIDTEIINTDDQSCDAEHEYSQSASPKTKSSSNLYAGCSSSNNHLYVDYEGTGYSSDKYDGGCEYEQTGNNRPLSTLSIYEQTTYNDNQETYADYDSLPEKERKKLERIEQKRIRKEKRDALPVFDLPRIVPISMFGCLGVGFILTILVAGMFASVLNGLNSDLDELRQDNEEVNFSFNNLSSTIGQSGVLEIPQKVADLQADIEETNSSLIVLQNNLNETKHQITLLDTNLNELNASLPKIEADIEEVSEAVTENTKKIAALQGALNDVNDSIIRVEEDIEALENRTAHV